MRVLLLGLALIAAALGFTAVGMLAGRPDDDL